MKKHIARPAASGEGSPPDALPQADDHDAIKHDTVLVSADGAPAPIEVTRAPEGTKSTEHWTNGRWAVTDFGLESRYVINGMPMPGDFAKADLLRQRPGQPGVANAALHLATKTWVDDPDALVDALAAALAYHHPGQTVIDVGATREETRRVWQQSRPSPRAPGKLGHDYFEDAEERWRSYRERRQYDEE